ncbi:hypothetical protein ACHELY_000098 [Vibrio vulnificus]|nr:hypothetical protein [Vibrio vulnificus]
MALVSFSELESDGQFPVESATLGLSQLKVKNRATVGNQMRRYR